MKERISRLMAVPARCAIAIRQAFGLRNDRMNDVPTLRASRTVHSMNPLLGKMRNTTNPRRRRLISSTFAAVWLGVSAMLPELAQAQGTQDKKPNIIVIFADDVGPWNVSAYHRGMMGGSTPNIDRIAREGALFTDYYAQQSCTAGRSAFITGQHPFRTGLLKAGLPAAKQGIQGKDPTIAELLKPLGYATSQIGKNHLGDRNEYLPTAHGFDEFFGYLYHLNAMEEPEDPNFPKNPEFRAKFGPRNVVDSTASDKDDPTEDPRFGRVGKQVVKDGGPLTRKRMETVEDEFLARSLGFIEKSAKANKPFFLWHSSTRLHVKTHLSPKWENKTGYGLAADAMADLDNSVGEILKKLDDLKIADNTIVVFTSDNGPEIFTWPDGGNTPFKGEKGTTWEGGFRVPAVVRWPGVIKPGSIVNEIMSHEDWLPTFLAAAGDPDVKTKLLTGLKAGDKTFKNHLDGYNFQPFFKGEVSKGPRHEIFYFDDGANLNALRYDDWKITFQMLEGNFFNGKRTTPNMPFVVNLRQDPFERFPSESMQYMSWMLDKLWAFVPAQVIVGQFLQSFREFPPSQKSGSFGVDQALEAIQAAAQGGGK
jgi:arylsulfatase A-like enzyme